MKTTTRSAITGITVASIAAASASIAGAHSGMPASTTTTKMPSMTAKTVVTKKNIVITDPRVRVVPPGSANTAAYMSIRSVRMSDALVRASVPASLAMKTELHLSTMDPETGRMAMVQQKRIGIARNTTRQLKMGSYHVMIMGLKKDVKPGMKVPITLTFLRAGTVKVVAVAKDM